MSVQSPTVVPQIEWDDSVVFVFSWNNQQFFAGFVHQQIATAFGAGSQVQVNPILQSQSTSQVQVTADPQSWLDTVKTAFRNQKSITITFDDGQSIQYTTQTNQNFKLQTLFSLAG